jgi:hypothetical protein
VSRTVEVLSGNTASCTDDRLSVKKSAMKFVSVDRRKADQSIDDIKE